VGKVTDTLINPEGLLPESSEANLISTYDGSAEAANGPSLDSLAVAFFSDDVSIDKVVPPGAPLPFLSATQKNAVAT
jgi:hypothetical protein